MSVYAELERKGFLNSDLVNASNSGVYGKMYKMINSFDPETGKTAEIQIEPNAIDIIFTSTGKPIVCYAGSAAPVSFDSAPQESATADTDK